MRWKKSLILICILAAGAWSGLRVAPLLKRWVSIEMAPRSINAYLRNHAVRKLQIGAGNVDYSEWLNTDITPSGTEVYLDATDTSRCQTEASSTFSGNMSSST